MSFLLDTNVPSEIRKGKRANPRVVGWLNEVDDDALHLSVMVIGEIRQGVHDLILVTRNTRDVARTGVRVLNPFNRPD